MSYLNKVELWREQNRIAEERRKRAKAAARRAGIAGLGLSAVQREAVQPKDGAGWFKRMLALMDPRTWKSKKTLQYEADVEEAKKLGLTYKEFTAKKAKNEKAEPK